MGNESILEMESFKMVVMLILLATAVFLTYYFHFVLVKGVIFTHFFYFPIILAAIWWRLKGLLIPIFLSIVLILSYFIAPNLTYPFYEDLSRVFIFLAIGIVVAVLSEKIGQKESKLIESEGKFRSVADSAVDGIITTDTDGKIVIFNSSLKNIFGYEIEEIKGKHVTMLMPDRFKQNFLDKLEMFKSTGNHESAGKTFETIGLKKDGNEFPFEISMATWGSKGKLFTTSIIRDVTDRKKMEKTLKESEKRYSITLDAVNDGLWDWNIPSGEAFFSPNYYKLLGYKPGEFPANYNSWKLLVHPDEIDSIEKQLQESIKFGRGFEIDLRMKTKSNEWLWVSTRGKTIEKDPIGAANRMVGTLSNITYRKNAELTLVENEEKFREVFNNANDAMFLHKLEDKNPGKFLEVNDVACQILGYTRYELQNMSPMDIDTPETIAQIPIVMENLFKKGETTFEAEQVTKDGELLPVEINTHIFTIRGEKYILSIARDIRERKTAEKALKNSEIKYRNIFENVQDIFYQTDKYGNIIEISPSIERYSGYKPSELIGKPVETVYFNPEDRKNLLKKIEETGEVFGYELELKTKSNTVLYVSVNAHFLFDSSENPIGIEGSLRDITERKNIEIQLKKSLEEKELLLKEIHHRVKNNLMIISSLLNLQSSYIKDKESQDIFKESQNRARSMALIHERLYQSTDLKRIDFGEYITSLANELFHTYVADPSLIELKINVDDIFLDINTAIPLGLIVNELITNSLKHAFPDSISGEINVDFHTVDAHYEFIVKDNGIGFPEDIDYQNTESLGLQMVTSLTDQIDGEMKLNRTNGTEFKIIFKELEV
jgi:PAS domain S-box-containing protein